MTTTKLFKKREKKSEFLLVVNKGPNAINLDYEAEIDYLEIFFHQLQIKQFIEGKSTSNANYIAFEEDKNKRKFAIVKELFKQHNFFLKYKYFIFLDDDIKPVNCNFNDIFQQFKLTGANIGQPALTRDSYFSHKITLQEKNFIWRKVNFVEVMCPIFSKEGLARYIDYFDSTISSFGLDSLWSLKEWNMNNPPVILDITPVKHLRPVRSIIGDAYKGLDPEFDKRIFFLKNKMNNFYFITIDGKLKNKNLTLYNQTNNLFLNNLFVNILRKIFSLTGFIINRLRRLRKLRKLRRYYESL